MHAEKHGKCDLYTGKTTGNRKYLWDIWVKFKNEII